MHKSKNALNMLAGCRFTFSFSSSKRCVPTWEEADSCNGNMMLLSVSFSCFYPLRISHPYLLMSGSLVWCLISASCRLVHDMRHSPRTTAASQRKLPPLRQAGESDERSAPDPKILSSVGLSYNCARRLESAEVRRFSKGNWRLWGSFHRKLFLPWLFQYKITMKIRFGIF